MLTVFNAAAAGSKNIQTLIILRFLAGAFGSSPLTNAGGVISDMFSASQRGLATSIFAAAPFLGPVIGPIGMPQTSLASRDSTLTLCSWWLRWPVHRLALD
jgi:MFS family permease